MPYLTVECDMRAVLRLAFRAMRLDYESRGNGLLRVVRLALCVESDRIVLCATEDIWIWYTPHRSQRSSKLSIQAQPDAI